jgi:hypothetical protein
MKRAWVCLVFIPFLGAAGEWGSWKSFRKNELRAVLPGENFGNQRVFIETVRGEPEVPYRTPGPGAVLPYLMIRLYQEGMRSKTNQCPSWPSCSRYGILSLQRYGGFLGTVMTVDRLFFREAHYFMHRYNPRIRADFQVRLWDPPQNNAVFSGQWIEPGQREILTERVKPDED